MWAWAWKHPWLALLALVGAVVITIGLFTGTVNRASCKLYGASTERETKYSFIAGCLVKSGEHWIPRKEIRSVLE